MAIRIQQTMRVKAVVKLEKYLGLLTLVGRPRNLTLNAIRNRVYKNLGGWKERVLSEADGEVLIKTVVRNIPSYVIGCFRNPERTCKAIGAAIKRFWWGESIGNGGINWLAWDKVCVAKKHGPGLGFRKLYVFKSGTLAKQAWRLQNSATSLLAKVLKGRYSNNRSDFMHPKQGQKPSYTWRSILAGRELLEKCAQWIIGNRAASRAGKDRFVSFSGLSSPRTQSAITVNQFDLVDKLIDKDRRMFGDDDAKAIKAIYLSYRLPDDLLAGSDNLGTEEEDVPKSREKWKSLWSLNLPPKVRHFTWMAVNNILATRDNLLKREITVPSVCPMCNDADESFNHLMSDCKWCKEVWKLAGLADVFARNEGMPVDAVVWDLIAKGDTAKLEQVCMTMWSIWNMRNSVVFEGKEPLPNQAVLQARSLLQDYQKEDVKKGSDPSSSTTTTTAPAKQVKWHRPWAGWFKVNTDAAINGSYTGLGVICRDHIGNVCFSAAKKLDRPMEPLLAEAVAGLWGFQLAKDKGFKQIQWETDSLLVVKDMNSQSPERGSIRDVIKDLRDLSKLVDAFICTHIRPRANECAHELSKHALSILDEVVWSNSYPDILEHFVHQDSAII